MLMYIVELILVLHNIFGTTLLLPPSFLIPILWLGMCERGRRRRLESRKAKRGMAAGGGRVGLNVE